MCPDWRERRYLTTVAARSKRCSHVQFQAASFGSQPALRPTKRGVNRCCSAVRIICSGLGDSEDVEFASAAFRIMTRHGMVKRDAGKLKRYRRASAFLFLSAASAAPLLPF